MRLESWAMMLALVSLAGCRNSRRDTGPPAVSSVSPQHHAQEEWFTDHAADAGLNFAHFNGMSGELYYSEIMAPGVALLDYDNDGDLDVFLVQGQMLGPGKHASQALLPPQGPLPLEGRLYRNDLEVHSDSTRTLRFTDVTEASRIQARDYGMGVATGDFNNDGCTDLFLTNLGPNQLLRNNCDGTFADVSEGLGKAPAASSWSVSAAFLDFDRDGWLDLFVGHYVHYSVDANIRCFLQSGGPNYCPPQVYRAQPSTLYHNNRDGSFTDVTAAAGMATDFGPTLGVSTADFNGDGWIDIYVANDGQPNQLWINQRDATFKNTGLLSGTAIGGEGKAKSSMGVDAGDFDNDGDEDLIVTTLTGQGSDVYVNNGAGVFEEQSARTGIRAPSLPYTGFGVGWLDFDNDGWLDLLTVNGTVSRDPQRPKELFSLQQRKQLFRSLGNARFEDVTGQAGAVFQRSEVGRGAAFGDLDNDGDTDVIVANDAGPVRLLINNLGNHNHWVGLRLASPAARPSIRSGRDLIGARAGIARRDGSTLWRRARSDGSYASANDPRVLVGLGHSAQAPTVKVIWPSGRIEEFANVAIDRYTTLHEGSR
ncbi:MAG: CRTAC1 family protein [Acidobacteriota bacterium]